VAEVKIGHSILMKPQMKYRFFEGF